MMQNQALAILKTGQNVFLTGEPGAGKTYTINNYVSYLRNHGVEPAITASTGIAATHLNGMTIHSWSGIGISKFLSAHDLEKIYMNSKIYKRINQTDVLIIDEISMLDAQTLSLVDQVCRTCREDERPFGGIQVILVGDFFQLPPVSRGEKAKFAFEAPVWEELDLKVCYITEQHRQEDSDFLDLLTAIRRNILENHHHKHLNKRLKDYSICPENITKLYSHNADVDRINQTKLEQIDKKSYTYEMTSEGKNNLVGALIKGCLSPEELQLKVGAVVMFTKNNPRDNYYNGSIGTVIDFDSTNKFPVVQLKNGSKVTVDPAEWIIEENGKIQAKITQIPLRLAWAITIHKSQGMSLDSAVVDLKQVFEYGQGYVALSRIRTLEGLHLLGYNDTSLLVHPEILIKDQELRNLSGQVYLALAEIEEDKLFELWRNYLTSIGGSLEKVEKTEKISTHEITRNLLLAGHSLEEIARIRELTSSTIISHLEKLAEKKELQKKDLKKFIPSKAFKANKKIVEALKKNDNKLTSTFHELQEKFTYDELKLIRAYNQA